MDCRFSRFLRIVVPAALLLSASLAAAQDHAGEARPDRWGNVAFGIDLGLRGSVREDVAAQLAFRLTLFRYLEITGATGHTFDNHWTTHLMLGARLPLDVVALYLGVALDNGTDGVGLPAWSNGTMDRVQWLDAELGIERRFEDGIYLRATGGLGREVHRAGMEPCSVLAGCEDLGPRANAYATLSLGFSGPVL